MRVLLKRWNADDDILFTHEIFRASTEKKLYFITAQCAMQLGGYMRILIAAEFK